MEPGRNEPGGCDQQRAGDHKRAVEWCRQLRGGGVQCVWDSEQLQRAADDWAAGGDCPATDEPGGGGGRGGGIGGSGGGHGTVELSVESGRDEPGAVSYTHLRA